jgi:hypothetical protein
VAAERGRCDRAAGAPSIAIIGALALMLAYRVSWNVVDVDLYHQMALIREAIASGGLAQSDVYAFTPTLPRLVYHEWGAGAIALVAASCLGGGGILLLKYGLALALGLVCARTARRAGADLPTVAWCALVAILMVDQGFSPVRAQAYSFLFAALTIAAIERDRARDRRWLVLALPVFIAWVNIHGGFVIGLALLGAHALELLIDRRPCWHVLALLVGLVAAVAINPYGLHYHSYLAGALTMRRPGVREWEPLWYASAPAHHQLAFVLSAAVFVYGAIGGTRRGAHGLLVVFGMAVLALRCQRILPFYAAAWLAFTPALLAGTPLHAGMRSLTVHRWTRAVALCACVIFGTLLLSRTPWRLEVPNRPAGSSGSQMLSYPVGAVNFLRASGFRGNLMTPFEQGAYVSWKLHPAVKVSLDSRYEAAYPEPVVDEQLRFYASSTWAGELLQRYRADMVLVPAYAPLRKARSPWPIVYEDDGFALHARPGLALAPVIGSVATADAFP